MPIFPSNRTEYKVRLGRYSDFQATEIFLREEEALKLWNSIDVVKNIGGGMDFNAYSLLRPEADVYKVLTLIVR